jgi:hypothetical protein
MIKTGVLVALFCLGLGSAPAGAGERPILVELFTSEGCSSCPPADALHAELAGRPEVLALSFHVDYWDRLGWKDPFSSAASTARQQRYAALLGLATVYTPQIVVDGKWQAVGSNRASVERALASARDSRTEMPMLLALDHGRARIKLGAGSAEVSGAVFLVGFDRRHVTAVRGGENDGRTLAHVDVVRELQEVAQFDGRAREIEAPIPWPCDRIAAILQTGDGRVVGVAVRDAEPL